MGLFAGTQLPPARRAGGGNSRLSNRALAVTIIAIQTAWCGRSVRQMLQRQSASTWCNKLACPGPQAAPPSRPLSHANRTRDEPLALRPPYTSCRLSQPSQNLAGSSSSRRFLTALRPHCNALFVQRPWHPLTPRRLQIRQTIDKSLDWLPGGSAASPARRREPVPPLGRVALAPRGARTARGCPPVTLPRSKIFCRPQRRRR